MVKQYMTGEERAAQEAAELEAAERQFLGEHVDPEAQTQDTPIEQPQEPEVQADGYEKRYKDLQSYHDKTVNELKAQIRELQGNHEPTTEEEVKMLREQLEALQGKEKVREVQSAVSQAQAAVGQAHPDFVNVINSPEFSQWIQGQPEVYRNAIYDEVPDASLAIDALTLFKVQSGHFQRQAGAEQKQLMDQAAMSVNAGHREVPASGAPKVWTWTEIERLSPHEYAKLEGEIDKAIAEGRVR